MTITGSSDSVLCANKMHSLCKQTFVNIISFRLIHHLKALENICYVKKDKIMAPDKGNSSRNACQRNFCTLNLMTFTFIKRFKSTFISHQQPSLHALCNKGFWKENVYNENPRRQISPLLIVSQVLIMEVTKWCVSTTSTPVQRNRILTTTSCIMHFR